MIKSITDRLIYITNFMLLAIESSCDETAAAVLSPPSSLLASQIASQVEKHRPYGGVVPELASRNHLIY